VTSDIKVSVVDTVGPKLNPVADRTILWPADGALATVVITPNASDNSAQPLRLSATVGAMNRNQTISKET
jgi:hypothetical protein